MMDHKCLAVLCHKRTVCLLLFELLLSYILCSVHAYIVFKDEQCARTALSHNMALVCSLSYKLQLITNYFIKLKYILRTFCVISHI